MNSNALVVKGGVSATHDGDTYKVTVSERDFRQQGNAFPITGIVNDYDIHGLEGMAKFRVTGYDYIGLLAQYNLVRFLANSTEDTNQLMLGANYMHVFQASGSPLAYFGYAHLDDQAVRPKLSNNPAYGDGTTVASRGTDIYTLYLQYSLTPAVDLVLTDYTYFRHDTGAFARDAVVDFGKDKTRLLSVGTNWRFRPMWTLRAQLARTTNDSNIALYSYSKTEGTVVLRRDFN